MKIKLYEKFMIGFFAFFLIIVTVWITVIPITKSKAFYMSEYKKNDTVTETKYTMDELSVITDQIIDFLFNKTDDMQVVIQEKNVFSNQALLHMRDVRTLYNGGQIIGWIIFGLWLVIGAYLLMHFKRLRSYLLKYSIIVMAIVLAVVIIAGVFAIVDFDYTFDLFHRIIFPNDQKYNDAFFSTKSNYDELPYIDNLMLVKILSIGLFMDVGLIIGVVLFIVLIAWFVMCIILNKKFKHVT